MSEGLFYLAVRKKDTEPYSFVELVNECPLENYSASVEHSIEDANISPTKYGLAEECALLFVMEFAREGIDAIIVQRNFGDQAITVPFFNSPGDFYVVAKHPSDAYFSFTGSEVVGDGLGRALLPKSLTKAIPEIKARGLLRYTCTQDLAKKISNYFDETYRESAIIRRKNPFDRLIILNKVECDISEKASEQLGKITKTSFDHKSRFPWPR